jgi:hypothetical protein
MATYYIATTGNDTTGDGSVGTPWATFSKALDEVSNGDTVVVDGGTYTGADNCYLDYDVANITWQVATGETATIDGEDEEPASFDPDNPTSSGYTPLVELTAAGIVWDGIDVKNSQGEGIRVSGANGVVKNADISYTFRAGLHLYTGSNGSLVEGCSVHHGVQGKGLYPAVYVWPSNVMIWNSPNSIIRTTTVYQGTSEGIDVVKGSDGVLIEFCHIYNINYSGIYISDCDNCTVRYNLVWGSSAYTYGTSYTGHMTKGGIKVGGERAVYTTTGHKIYGNFVAYTGRNFLISGQETGSGAADCEIYNNTFIDPYAEDNVKFAAGGLNGHIFRNNIVHGTASGYSLVTVARSGQVATKSHNLYSSTPTSYIYNSSTDIISSADPVDRTTWSDGATTAIDWDDFINVAANPGNPPAGYNLSSVFNHLLNPNTETLVTVSSWPIGADGSRAGSGVQDEFPDDEYVGWYTSSGEPTTDPTVDDAYLAGERIYLRKVTSTEAGRARTVRFYIGESWDPDYSWVVAYKDVTGSGDLALLGSATLGNQIYSSWTNAIELVEPQNGDMLFDSGQDLYFGFAADPGADVGGSADTAYGREDTGGTGLYYTDTVSLDGGPPQTIASSEMASGSPSAGRDLAFVFGYTTTVTADTTDPVVTITAPTSDSSGYEIESDGAAEIQLGGTASDAVGVVSVSWEDDHGNAGDCVGTEVWDSGTQTISAGSTTFTITAEDAAGNTGEDTISVSFVAHDDAEVAGFDSANNPPSTAPAVGVITSDRTYLREWTATEAGTLSGIYFYVGTDWDITAAWVVVYVTTDGGDSYTLKATGSITGVAYGAWNYAQLSAVFGQTLNFAAGSVLAFGGSYDTFGSFSYGRNTTGGSGMLYAVYDLQSSGPWNTLLSADLEPSNYDPAYAINYFPAGADIVDPVVTITSHTSPYSAGTAPTITIAGTASDAGGVATITWESDQGGSGEAEGTTSWMIDDAALSVGTNVFTITATDYAGNTGEAELTVTRVSASSSRLPKIYDGDKTSAAMTYTSTETGGEVKWIQYAYKIQDIIDRVIVWSPDDMSGYVGLSEDGSTWNYYGGADADGALDDDGRLVDYGTDVPTYSVLLGGGGAYNMPLPQARTARYGRFYFHVPENGTRTINEMRVVREVVAEQVYAENLGAISADITGVSVGTLQSQVLDGDTGVLMDLNNSNIIVGGTISKKIELDGEDGIAYIREGGKLVVGDNNIMIDSTDISTNQGRIEVAPNGGKAGQDYVLIESGNVTQMYYSAGAHRPYGTLSRIEVGTGTHGETITIPGYWREQPRVVIMPESIAVYNASYSAQNQKLICRPSNIQLVSGTTDRYQFTGFMALEISSASVVGDGTMTGYVYTPTSRNDFPPVTVTCSSVEAGCQRVAITYSHNCCFGIPSQMYAISRTVNFDVYYSAAWHTVKSEYWRRYTTYADRIYSYADSGWVGANITSYRLTMSGTNAYEIAGGGDQKSQSLEPVSRTEYLSSTTQQVTGQYTWMASGR